MRVPQLTASMTWTLLCVALFLASAFNKVPIYCMYIATALYAVGILLISAVYSGVIVCCCCRRISSEDEDDDVAENCATDIEEGGSVYERSSELDDPQAAAAAKFKTVTKACGVHNEGKRRV